MNETKFTKGPWKLSSNPGGPGDQPAFPSVIDMSGRPHGEDIVCSAYGDQDTVKANAYLIAAAPEMYEMLDRLVATYWGQHGGGCEQDLRDAKDLLEKARGES